MKYGMAEKLRMARWKLSKYLMWQCLLFVPAFFCPTKSVQIKIQLNFSFFYQFTHLSTTIRLSILIDHLQRFYYQSAIFAFFFTWNCQFFLTRVSSPLDGPLSADKAKGPNYPSLGNLLPDSSTCKTFITFYTQVPFLEIQ